VIAFIAHRQYANCSPPLPQFDPGLAVEQSMKNLKYISSSSQSVAKLIGCVVLLWTCTIIATDAPSPFAPIIGVWQTHFNNGVDRLYRIGEDGTISFEQKGPIPSGSSKVTMVNGEFLAEFGGKLALFYRVSEDSLKVEIFPDRSRYEKHEPSAFGTAHRDKAAAIPNNAPVVPAAPVAAPLHSVDEILATVDTSKPLKPFDVPDQKAISALEKNLNAQKGREIELQFELKRRPERFAEARFRWQLPQVTAGADTFTPWMTVYVKPEMIPAALEVVPGHTATLKGTLRGFNVVYGALYFAVDATSLTVNNPEPKPTDTASQSQVQLANDWDTPMQGGTATMDDLAKLFGTIAKPNVDLSASKSAPLYDAITYLMPVREAIQSLKLNGWLPSKVLVACPGLPRNSLYYYAIDGHFDGQFNRMYLVVDRADQVVSVELVDEAPKNLNTHTRNDEGWHTYDFINDRTKALTTMKIEHKIALLTTSQFEEPFSREIAPRITDKNTGWRVARVDSVLLSDEKQGSVTRIIGKQQTRWYVPRQLAELILTCVQKGGK
jgi:hypothetical protein